MNAPLPADEAQRLATLQEYEILDSPPEEAFDDLALLAAQVCQVPSATVSLVDRDRQWFKARIAVQASETPRNAAFCAHTILRADEIMEVRDAQADPKFASSPLVTEDPHIRFYAGAPLVAPNGQALGALCVMDRVPHELTPDQRTALRALSRHVVTQLELRRQGRELARKAEENARDKRLLEQQFEQLRKNEHEGKRLLALAEKSRRALLGLLEDQKIAENALRESQALYSSLVEQMPVGVFRKDEAGRYVFVNSAFCRLRGTTPDQFVGRSPDELSAQENPFKAEATKHHEEIMRTGRSLEVVDEYHRPDGKLLYLHVIKSPVFDTARRIVGTQGVVLDITDRRQAEAGLKLFRTLMDRSGEMIEVVDPETGRIIDMNERACAAHDYSREEYLKLTVFDLHPALTQERYAEHQRRLRNGGPITIEGMHRRKDGTTFPTEVSLTLVNLDRDYLVAVVRDITERRQGEAALRESEERFRQAVENIREVFWMTDPAKNAMLYVSPAYEKIWGRTCRSLYDNPRMWLEAIHPEDRARVLAAATERQARGDYDETYRILRPDGSLRWIRDRAYPIENESGRVYRIVGTAEDVTGRKELEIQLTQMQRMESVGRMAGGIAHDLNNILAPILMGAPLLRIGLPPAQVEKTLATIETSARRGADLVKQLLMFGRGIEGRRQAVRLKDLVREMEEIMRETFPKNIVISSDLPIDIWPLMGDATQLHQVLLNLCVNARDAMPSGGRLSLTARNVRIDENYAGMSPEAKPGAYACLTVADSGTGIPPEVMDKIFDPFFTTKEVGKGTGLGLSTLIGIVKNHAGFVTVESEVGTGTTFKIYLPAETGAVPAESAPAISTALPRGRGEMILVVDDEASIRDVIGRTLEQFGYRVLTATDGGDACAKFALHLTEVKVVLTDLDMPVMGGVIMIQVLKKMNPAIKVVISSGKMSGLADPATTAALGELEVGSILTKPYTADAVLRLLNDLLTKPPATSASAPTPSA
ncbi:MAG TPA: PAS domain S-box protein [Opitutaceae bacterium]|nr:PAS domain S-box protein [Opitutaceae bacterium]